MSNRTSPRRARSRTTALLAALCVTGATGCGTKGEPQTAKDAAAKRQPADENATTAGPRKVDLSDGPQIVEVAKLALTAYLRKDVEALAEVGPRDAKEKVIFIQPHNPNYPTLFGDDTWFMQSLRAWNGGEIIRVERGIDAAHAFYHEDDEYRYAVVLHKDADDPTWRFHHLKRFPTKPGAKQP